MSNHALTLLVPESWKSASSQNVSQTVSNRDYGLRRSNQAFTLLAPDFWKSASGLILSQTDAFDSGWS